MTTPPSVVSAMLKLADVTGSDIVYDLGSGDGRIVIAAARDFGARAVGVEIDRKLVQESERNAESAGVSSRVRFIQQDLFQADITEATVVTLFLLPGVNGILAPKLLKELRPGTRIVSYWYDMGEWQPDKTIRIDTLAVYYWVVPADVGGMWTLQIPTAEGVSPQILSLRQAFQRTLRLSEAERQKARSSRSADRRRAPFLHRFRDRRRRAGTHALLRAACRADKRPG